MQNQDNNMLHDKYMKMIESGEWLYDEHMDHFGTLLKRCSDYAPQETWRIQLPHTIKRVSPTAKYIQILHSGSTESGAHWVCAYYDTKSIFIYDSFNSKMLHKDHAVYLRKLFPFYPFETNPVKFPTVQRQSNSSDCGVFAIAFAVSLLNGYKPDEINYDASLMRGHLYKIFKFNIIKDFPCINQVRDSLAKDKFYCETINKRHSQNRVKETWAGIVKKPRTGLHSQPDSYTNMISSFPEEPVKQNVRHTHRSMSGIRELTTIDNRNVLIGPTNGQAEHITHAGNSETFCKSIAPVLGDDTVKVKKVDITAGRSNNSMTDNSLITQIGNELTNNVIAATDKKSHRRERRNAQPILSETSMNIIKSGAWLTDLHMDQFIYLVKSHSEYSPRNSWRIQMLDTIEPVSHTTKHIQILHSSNQHWVCAYFDTKSIFIYDSFNLKRLHADHEKFLRKLFPFYQFDKKPIKFPTVQSQLNASDCGVFAVAFGISLLNGYKTDKITYNIPLMRSHLVKLFTDNVVDEFPRDLSMQDDQAKQRNLTHRKRKLTSEITRQLHLQRNENRQCLECVQQNVIVAHETNELGSHSTFKGNILDQLPQLSYEKSVEGEVPTITTSEVEYQDEIKRPKFSMDQKSMPDFTLHNNHTQHLNQIIKEVSVAKTVITNAEKLRARKRELYHLNAAKQRARKREYYNLNVEKQRSRKRELYCSDVERRRNIKKERYIKNAKTEVARQQVFYLINRENICDKNRKRYRQKKENEVAKHKRNAAKNIIAKYRRINSTNTIIMLQSKAAYVTKLSSLMTSEPSQTERRIKAESIINWCIHNRDSLISKMRKSLRTIKKKAEVFLTKAALFPEHMIQDNLKALCGPSKHIDSAEPYFVEAAYKNVRFSESIVINQTGHAVNILPLVEKLNKKGKSKKHKNWQCDDTCKTNDIVLIRKYVEFFKCVSACTLKNIHKFVIRLECTAKHANGKLGHSQICYMAGVSCKSILLPVQILSAHFPSVRYIQRLVYELSNCYTRISIIDIALNDGNLSELQRISEVAQQNANTIANNLANDINLNEEDIIDRNKSAFKALTKRSMDTPRVVCISCEKLCFSRDVTSIQKIKIPVTTNIWKDLIQHTREQGINCEYVCNYCLPKLRQNIMPPRCILNNLITKPVPELISSLNEYERILIQRAKSFQIVQRMGTVANKNLPHREMVQKVKGRTFHLPLPIEETLKKICPETEPINIDHELYILVRGIPTKSKLVWEQLVDIKKVWDALIWLKANNPLYSKIELPASADVLLAGITEIEFQVDGQESEVDDNEETILQKRESTDNFNANEHPALLTQVSQSDELYDHLTIYPMYDKRPNETATDLYQMLKIRDVPLDKRHKSLDLLCYPHLYPYGCNGQHEHRSTRLTDAEFIKSRLMSKHPQFRKDLQYVFYLLDDANNRQVSGGIYHKLNTTNQSERCTAARFLEKLSKEELEGNLNSIFSRLRNTPQYWSRPRNDIACMIQNYGPATWFLTLSPSEWLWSDLTEYLRDIGRPSSAKMSPSQLIATDPVSASRFIENKFKAMLDFICSPDNIIGEVTHYFWRREYQGRGMQHFHLLIWIKDAPVLGKSPNEDVSL